MPNDLSSSITTPVGLAPLNLGLVCKRWQDIVLAAPKLWATIVMDLEPTPESPDHGESDDEDYQGGSDPDEYVYDAAKFPVELGVLDTYLEHAHKLPWRRSLSIWLSSPHSQSGRACMHQDGAGRN